MNWMHSCKKVAELLSQRLGEPLGLIDGLRLRVHLSMCDNCSNVAKQLSSVNTLAADLFSGEQVVLDDGEPGQRPDRAG